MSFLKLWNVRESWLSSSHDSACQRSGEVLQFLSQPLEAAVAWSWFCSSSVLSERKLWNVCARGMRVIVKLVPWKSQRDHYVCYWHGTDSKRHSSKGNKNCTAKHIPVHWLTCAFECSIDRLCALISHSSSNKKGKKDFGNSPRISVWHARRRGRWLNSIF